MENVLTKGDRSQRSLKIAAREIFKSDGYTNSRVQDIAARAGFSNGAFYRYFSDKRAVMMALMQDLLEYAYEFAHSPWEAGNPANSIYTSTRRYLNYYRSNADLFSILVEASQVDTEVEQMWAAVRTDVIDRITRMLTRAREEGLLRPKVNPAVAASLLAAMTDHYAYLWLVLERLPDSDIDEVSDQITRIWSSGVFCED